MGATPIFIITLFLLIVAIGIIMLVLVYQKKQLQYLREKEQLKVTFEKEILQSQLEIQEQTFKNISQEIHDNIGQVLTLAKLNVNTMPDFNSKDLQEKIGDTRELITKAIQDLRDLSKSLNTDFVTNLGLVKSIEYELSIFKKAAGLQTNFVIEGSHYSLSHQKELILFRIFQEGLNNIIKHSKASLVNVFVKYDPNKFLLQITDDGDGFDVSEINKDQNEKQGLGIRNMENRSRIIGAAYNIYSEPGKGTTVKIELPLLEGI